MGQTFQQRGWNDREVTVRRSELLDVLKKNRGTHVNDFKAACSGYRELATQKLQESLKDVQRQLSVLKEGDKLPHVFVSFSLPPPVSHERTYDQIIRMMEMEVADNVVLTASQFGCFVMDDWEWTQQWRDATTPYFGGTKASWQPE